jgi:hypothetical protein
MGNIEKIAIGPDLAATFNVQTTYMAGIVGNWSAHLRYALPDIQPFWAVFYIKAIVLHSLG